MKFGFTTLFTDKIEETTAFYRDVLGFELYQELSPAPGIKIAFLKNGGSRLEILQNDHSPVVDNSKSSIQLTFLVDNIDNAYAEMKEAGVQSVSELMILPSGLQMFNSRDPNGVALGFVKE
ncbi:MAG TPA: hypothetical protein DCO79_03135 [Spirochaeta sp.]|nr:hypothetical protein [Spirochaeta sp.]